MLNLKKQIQQLFSHEYATTDDVENAFCAYKKRIDEIRSDHRNEAAAFSDEYKHYESASINCCGLSG